DGHGRWSPDGATIAFISARDKPKPQIYTLPSGGGEATSLTDLPEGTISSFRWSPDGTMLALKYRRTEAEWTEDATKKREENGGSIPPRVIDDVYYRHDGDGYFNAARFALSIVDVESGRDRLVFDRDKLGWFTYDWSPDSQELIVSANTNRDALLKWWKYDLCRVDVRSRKVHKLADLPTGNKTAVSWSPDGKRIAYAGHEGKEIWGVHNTRLYTCSPGGGDVRDLTGHDDYCLSSVTLSDTAEASFDVVTQWSPDSRRILMNFGWHGGTHVVSVDTKQNRGAGTHNSITFHTKGRQSVAMGNLSDDGKRLAMARKQQAGHDQVDGAHRDRRVGEPEVRQRHEGEQHPSQQGSIK
ncbi:MAG: PD40 domain-containing protein, partial [Bacteroidetes bacterium]|nr:PD40 domain-containing protein [Bacteroidota bacterium]